MRRFLMILGAAGSLGGCVVAQPVAVAPRPAAAVAVVEAPRADPYCRQERAEARAAQGAANREAREAAWGGRRQAHEAAAAQSEADRQRWQAQRAC